MYCRAALLGLRRNTLAEDTAGYKPTVRGLAAHLSTFSEPVLQNKMLFKLFLLSLIALGAAASCSKAKEGTLSISGSGSTEVQPDVAKVFLRVEATKPSATAAREEAANVTTAVINAVDAVEGVSRQDITTLDVSVQPQISYDNNGTQNITGYQFAQRLQVKVLNLTNDILGAVIDAAVQAGGEDLRIESIQAELSPALKEQSSNTARVEAVDNAKATAKVLAQAGDVTLEAIKTFTDGYVSMPMPYTPTPNAAMSKEVGGVAQDSSTPINIGATEVTATVTITWTICN